MRSGRAERRGPDYLRHGTTNLFAALHFKAGAVIGQPHRRHRAVEFRQFLEAIEHQVLPRFALHLIIDNYATHKTPAIKRWLPRHARFQLHFTPTGASWLNLVERWFVGLTENNCAASSIATPANCKMPSATTSNSTTVIPNPSSGPKPLTKSSNRLLDFVNALRLRTPAEIHGSREYGRLVSRKLVKKRKVRRARAS
jgi:transposase